MTYKEIIAEVAKYHLLGIKPHIHLKEGTVTEHRLTFFDLLDKEYPLPNYNPGDTDFYLKPIYTKGLTTVRTNEIFSLTAETI